MDRNGFRIVDTQFLLWHDLVKERRRRVKAEASGREHEKTGDARPADENMLSIARRGAPP